MPEYDAAAMWPRQHKWSDESTLLYYFCFSLLLARHQTEVPRIRTTSAASTVSNTIGLYAEVGLVRDLATHGDKALEQLNSGTRNYRI